MAVEAHSQESEVRVLLRAGKVESLKAYVLFRAVGSDRAVVKMLGQEFAIDCVRRLVNAGVKVDCSRRIATLVNKTQREVNAMFARLPTLTAEDFK